MPHPVALVRIDIGVPQPLDTAAQHLAWAMAVEKREVLRLALAVGLQELGGLFDAAPETHVVPRGRPPKQPQA